MFCTECGGENTATAKFCASCGGRLADARADQLDVKGTVVGLIAGHVLANRYHLERMLGRGGMGQVWLARDQELDLVVAIKVVNDLLARDPQAMARLRDEARLTIPLRHPHIVSVNHFESSGPITFLVMEYVEGESLAERLARDRTLPEAEAKRIALAVVQALSHAHDKRVLHRDVKPANILLARNGDVRLADFGIARVASDSLSRLTGAQTSGTLLYMAPEVVEGEVATPAADFYGVGATLYEMLAGHPPFHTGDLNHQILHKAPKPLPNVSAELNAFLASLLAKKGAARPNVGDCIRSLKVGPMARRATSHAQQSPPSVSGTAAGAKEMEYLALLSALMIAASIAGFSAYVELALALSSSPASSSIIPMMSIALFALAAVPLASGVSVGHLVSGLVHTIPLGAVASMAVFEARGRAGILEGFWVQDAFVLASVVSSVGLAAYVARLGYIANSKDTHRFLWVAAAIPIGLSLVEGLMPAPLWRSLDHYHLAHMAAGGTSLLLIAIGRGRSAGGSLFVPVADRHSSLTISANMGAVVVGALLSLGLWVVGCPLFAFFRLWSRKNDLPWVPELMLFLGIYIPLAAVVGLFVRWAGGVRIGATALALPSMLVGSVVAYATERWGGFYSVSHFSDWTLYLVSGALFAGVTLVALLRIGGYSVSVDRGVPVYMVITYLTITQVLYGAFHGLPGGFEVWVPTGSLVVVALARLWAGGPLLQARDTVA